MVPKIFKKISLLSLFFLAASSLLFSQPSLSEIKKLKIKSTTEIATIDSEIHTKKTIYNIYGHDSLIYYQGKLSFYSTSEVDDLNRLKILKFYNGGNNREEEFHMFAYKNDGSYTIEIIAQGAGLIETSFYTAEHLLIKNKDSDDFETIYQYNQAGKAEKIFQHSKKTKKRIIALTTFDKNGIETKTETFGDEPSEIFYEHNSTGLITKMRLRLKKLPSQEGKEIIYKYEF